MAAIPPLPVQGRGQASRGQARFWERRDVPAVFSPKIPLRGHTWWGRAKLRFALEFLAPSAERARNRNCVLRLVLQDNYPEPFHGSRGSRVMRRERTLRESAAAALTQSVLTGRDDPNLRVQAIVRGFEILSRGRPGRMEFGSDEEALPELFIKGAGFYGAQLNAGHAVGTVQSIEHALRALDKSAEDEHERLARSEKMLSDYREQLGKTFVHEARVKELLAKQDELNRALELDNCERQVAPEEAGEADQIPDCRGDQADRAGEQDA